MSDDYLVGDMLEVECSRVLWKHLMARPSERPLVSVPEMESGTGIMGYWRKNWRCEIAWNLTMLHVNTWYK